LLLVPLSRVAEQGRKEGQLGQALVWDAEQLQGAVSLLGGKSHYLAPSEGRNRANIGRAPELVAVLVAVLPGVAGRRLVSARPRHVGVGANSPGGRVMDGNRGMLL
jgi:hypothetical protein